MCVHTHIYIPKAAPGSLVNTYVCINTYVHIYIYIYIYIYTRTHICLCTNSYLHTNNIIRRVGDEELAAALRNMYTHTFIYIHRHSLQ